MTDAISIRTRILVGAIGAALACCAMQPGEVEPSPDADASAPSDASPSADAPTAPDAAIAPDAAPQPRRPNVVVVMADDLDLGLFDRILALHRLPHIEASIVRPGERFTNSFASNPLCAPSRATFLTGLYPHNTGVWTNSDFHQFNDGQTLATWLHAAGYRTGHVGKYLNGYGAPGHEAYVPPGWDDWQATIGDSTYRMYDYSINDNGRVVPYGFLASEYQTDVLAHRAVDFVDESHRDHPGQPMFLVVTPLATHAEKEPVDAYGMPAFPGQHYGGIRPPPRYQNQFAGLSLPNPPSLNEADVSDKPSWIPRQPLTDDNLTDLTALYRQRAAALLAVDDLVGDVVDALDRSGELANTMLVFMSDNGYLLGQHRADGKGNVYEESIRVPLAIRMPGDAVGRVVAAYALNTDLAPTIVDVAGAGAGFPADGRSLVPMLRGTAATAWRQRVFLEHAFEASNPDANTWAYTGVRTAPTAADYPDRVFAVLAPPGAAPSELELYNLLDDPSELLSRHAFAEAAPTIALLRASLQSMHGCRAAGCAAAENE